MGSHSSFCLDVSKFVSVVEADIINYGNSLPAFKDGDFGGWMWRRFSPESKWHGGDEVACAMSKKFVDVVFRLRCRGDYSYTTYWLNGEQLPFEFIFSDPLPSKTLFAKKLKEKKKLDYFAQIARQQAAAKKQLEDDAAELRRLEERQAVLKARMTGAVNG